MRLSSRFAASSLFSSSYSVNRAGGYYGFNMESNADPTAPREWRPEDLLRLSRKQASVEDPVKPNLTWLTRLKLIFKRSDPELEKDELKWGQWGDDERAAKVKEHIESLRGGREENG